MIEKLKPVKLGYGDGLIGEHPSPPSEMMDKINELVEAVNKISKHYEITTDNCYCYCHQAKPGEAYSCSGCIHCKGYEVKSTH